MTQRFYSKEHGRFKYAEEHAYRLDAQYGAEVIRWRLSRAGDKTYEEDGETYTRPVYLVEWFESEET